MTGVIAFRRVRKLYVSRSPSSALSHLVGNQGAQTDVPVRNRTTTRNCDIGKPLPPLPKRDLAVLRQEHDRLCKLRDAVRQTARDIDMRARLNPMADVIQEDIREIRG